MEKLDARKLPSGALEEKRRLSVKLRKEGMTRAQIGEVVGVHPDTVGRCEGLRSARSKGIEVAGSGTS